eukprot:1159220-Pelagomonas_calceolata.AAC.4
MDGVVQVAMRKFNVHSNVDRSTDTQPHSPVHRYGKVRVFSGHLNSGTHLAHSSQRMLVLLESLFAQHDSESTLRQA